MRCLPPVNSLLAITLALLLLLCFADATGPYVIPTVVVPTHLPDAETNICSALFGKRGTPPDVELGPAEVIRGFQNFGDISLFGTAHEKLERGAELISALVLHCLADGTEFSRWPPPTAKPSPPYDYRLTTAYRTTPMPQGRVCVCSYWAGRSRLAPACWTGF